MKESEGRVSFTLYLLIGWAFVALQGFLAHRDGGGYLTQSQMRSHGVKGWSFIEHGGMWADVFIISPVTAYILSVYRQVFVSGKSLLTLYILIIAVSAFGFYYSEKSKTAGIPEAHTHDGKTTYAGMVHGVYALLAGWVIICFYLFAPESLRFRHDIVWISILLTPFFCLGAVKFNPNWKMDKFGWFQTVGGPCLVWAIAAFRLFIARY